MNKPALITLQSVPDEKRGLLCIAEINQHLPFLVKRYFTMTGMQKGMVRGNHAHHAQSQYFNALTGAFDITVEGRNGKETYHLDNPSKALNVPPLHWVTIVSLEDSGTIMVCASDIYDKADYICDRAVFEAALRKS